MSANQFDPPPARSESDSSAPRRAGGAWWGAQTERLLENFRIGTERQPPEITLRWP